MSTAQLIALDLVVAVLAAAAWLGAGAVALNRRPRIALGLFGAAILATLARIGTVAALAGAGWWFVQEKLTAGAPLIGLTAIAAVAWGGPPLLRAARGGGAVAAPAAVALLVAGYAAVESLLVTVLIGYPATPAVGVLGFALVGVAALVTWRALGRRLPRAAVAATLAIGLAGVGVAVLPGPPAPALAHHGRSVTALSGPATPALGGTVRRFTLTARTATVRLASGRRVAAWTYNGQAPGPALTATQGDLIEVRLRNADITAGVTLHWHGYDVPNREDGAPEVTQRAVLPGKEFRYRFRADQAGTYWYHTHSVSDRGVALGLYGALVVAPRAGDAADLDLTLLAHTFDGRLALGRHDETISRRAPVGASVRLRLINTDSTPHRFALAGTAYRIVAIDGGDLRRPTPLARVGLRLPAGGRYDLTFRMPDRPVTLVADDRVGLRLRPSGASSGAVPDTTAWPEFDPLHYGAPASTELGRVDRDVTLVLDRGLALTGGRPRYAHTVNGRAAPNIPSVPVREGDVVRFTVVNRGRETHPWHLHGHRVLVLSRDGRTPTGSPLWLDTFDVRPGEVWRVAFRADNPGIWMNHCHDLGHAAAGMTLHLAYRGVHTPFHGSGH